jgi:hypothetical protein
LIFLFVFYFFSFLNVQAQQTTFSVHTHDQKLSALLEEVTQKYNYKFAFDADSFSTITTTINLENASIDQFLAVLCKQNSLTYKLIDGTYVLYPAPPVKPVVPKQKIQGRVSDSLTNESLIYSFVNHGTSGTMTNELGLFSFEQESGNSIPISVSYLGYHRIDTVLQAGYSGFLNLKLVPFSMEITEINIHAREKNVLELSQQNDAIAFNPKQTTNIPRVDENDMVNALTFIPGVNFLSGSYSGLSIRGGSPSENLITIDGIPVLETSHLFGNVSVLNAKFIKQAFVSRGGYDASYGDRVSGIVELTGKTGRQSNPEADVSANLISGNVFAAIPVGKKVSLSGAYHQSFVDQWQNYLFNRLQSITETGDASSSSTDGASLTPTIKYRDANGKLAIRPNKNQEINFNVLMTDESRQKDFQFNNQRSYKTENANGNSLGGSANWSIQTGNWLNKFSASFTGLSRNSLTEAGRFANLSNPGNGKKPKKGNNRVNSTKYEMESDQNEVNEQKVSWQSEINHPKFQHKFGAGMVAENISYRFEAQQTTGKIPVDSLNEDRHLNIYHAYYEQQFSPWKPLKFRAGIRTDYCSETKQLIYQPRGGIYFSPYEGLQFYYTAGKYAQYLSQIRKIDVYGNFALAWYLPDATGKGLLNSIHHVFGGKFEKGKLLINLEFYQKTTDGKMNLFASVYKKASETRIEYKAYPGNEISRGMDVFVQYQDKQWTQMLAYTLSKSDERYDGYNSGEYFPSFNDQRHRLRVVEMYRIKSWIVSSNWTLNTGFPTPVSTRTSTLQFNRLSNFSQLDLGLVKRFHYKHFSFDAGASLLNVFNRKNILETDYFTLTDASGTSTMRSELNAISFTPVFYINLRGN